MTDAPRPPETLGALELALAAARREAALEAPAREVLTRNARLLEEQIGLARNERFRARIKAVRDLSIVLLVVVLIGGAGAWILSAKQARGLVVEPLRTPPEFAAQGLDGPVLAARLLDRLSAMQAATDSSRAPEQFANNWGDDLQVELPQTGVSVGELHRALRRSLGRETRVSGELVRTPEGLAITTRLGSQPGVTVAGGAGELERLLDRASEAIYRRSQPYRYAVWLSRREGGNPAADEPILRELATSPSKTERLWAHVGLAVNALEGDRFDEAEAIALEGLRLDPSFHKLLWNLSDVQFATGRAEANLHTERPILRRHARPDPRVTEASRLVVLRSSGATAASAVGDHAEALELYLEMSTLPEYADNVANGPY